MQSWLSAAELSKSLGRPVSTIRLWRDTYDVPQRINEDGVQTFPLEVYEAIVAMRADDLTPREIKAELARHGEHPVAPQRPGLLAEIAEQLRKLHEKVDWLIERERERSEP